MISAPLGMGFPLSAQVLGKRLVICFGSFFMFLMCESCTAECLCIGDTAKFSVGYGNGERESGKGDSDVKSVFHWVIVARGRTLPG
jgi:hypothetical protein